MFRGKQSYIQLTHDASLVHAVALPLHVLSMEEQAIAFAQSELAVHFPPIATAPGEVHPPLVHVPLAQFVPEEQPAARPPQVPVKVEHTALLVH